MATPSWSAMKERDDLNKMKNTWMEYVTIFDDSSDDSDSSMDILFDNGMMIQTILISFLS
jgi:hypothetical protein